MRMLLILALALAAAPAGAYHEASEPSDGTVKSFKRVDPPRAVPDELFVLDAAGRQVRFSDYRGKIVLINLWATWCPPCVRELPALDRLAGRLAGTDFAVMTVSLDEGGTAQAGPFFRRLEIRHLPLLADAPKRLSAFFPIDVLPANFVLDRQGQVTHYLRSFVDWDDPAAETLFVELTEAGRPGTGQRAP